MHDEDFSDHILRVSGGLFRALCPKACIVRWAHRERDAMNREHGDGHVAPCSDNMAMERCATTPWSMGSLPVLETGTGDTTTIFQHAAL